MNRSLKNMERALIVAGVALVFSGGVASAAILWTSAAAAAGQPGNAAHVARNFGTNPSALGHGAHGPDRLSAAATYIGISVADLRTQLASGKSLTDIAVAA